MRHFRAWVNLHVVKERQGGHGRLLRRRWHDHQARECLLSDAGCLCARRGADLHVVLTKLEQNLAGVSGAARTELDRRTIVAVRP
jgi:hypothetical protein